METLTLPSKYDGKHALNCLEQEIRQMQGGKITCKQKGKILIIEKELKILELIKDTIVKDTKRYIKLKEDTNNPFMLHYYQGKIDYIGQLKVLDETLMGDEDEH